MKFTTAISILSATGGAIVTMHGEAPVYQKIETPPMVHAPVPAPVVTPPMFHTPAPVHNMAPPPMLHETKAPAAHQTVAAPLAGVTHTVRVGGSGLVYTPPMVHAAVGDVVHFVFLAKNHTLTQSTFGEPCKKMQGGLDSGFMPNDANSTESAPTFEVPVTTLEPSWWYCKQRAPKFHCTSGMVFAVNPTAEKSFEAFLELAKAGAEGDGAAVAPPPKAGEQPAGGNLTLSVDNGGVTPPAATPPPALLPPAPVPTDMVAGWNQGANPSACNCACFCGVGGFPSGSGVGAYGGFAGSLPAPW